MKLRKILNRLLDAGVATALALAVHVYDRRMLHNMQHESDLSRQH